MNNDDFEKKLQALTRALHRPDPTRSWKAEILARARLEAGAIPRKHLLPPRGLMLSWAAAWLAIAMMTISTPRNSSHDSASKLAASRAAQRREDAAGINASPQALIAFAQHLNSDLP
jgi:hypothetical protein